MFIQSSHIKYFSEKCSQNNLCLHFIHFTRKYFPCFSIWYTCLHFFITTTNARYTFYKSFFCFPSADDYGPKYIRGYFQ